MYCLCTASLCGSLRLCRYSALRFRVVARARSIVHCGVLVRMHNGMVFRLNSVRCADPRRISALVPSVTGQPRLAHYLAHHLQSTVAARMIIPQHLSLAYLCSIAARATHFVGLLRMNPLRVRRCWLPWTISSSSTCCGERLKRRALTV